MRPNPIIVTAYDPAWREAFRELQARLAAALAGGALAIEHVGSTSVVGLAAKPILDVDVVIASPADFPASFTSVKARLEGLGYRYEGDRGIPGREAFRAADSADVMRHHLYVCAQDAAELRRHLALRDFLRANPAARERYGAIKRRAAELFPYDIDGYLAYKGPFIERVYRELRV